jgi:hypothetical protein
MFHHGLRVWTAIHKVAGQDEEGPMSQSRRPAADPVLQLQQLAKTSVNISHHPGDGVDLYLLLKTTALRTDLGCPSA